MHLCAGPAASNPSAFCILSKELSAIGVRALILHVPIPSAKAECVPLDIVCMPLDIHLTGEEVGSNALCLAWLLPEESPELGPR